MGARAYKGGGGFLNNVDAEFIGYNFQTTFEGTHDPTSRTLFTRFSFKEDGKDKPSEITLKTGVLRRDYEGEIEISENGKVVAPDDIIWFKGQPGGRVFFTLQYPLDGGQGFPADRLPEDVVDFRPALGTRVRLVQVVDEETQLYYGRKALGDGAKKATKEQIFEAGKRTDEATGRKYNRTVPEIDSVLSVPAGKAVVAAKANGKVQPAQDELIATADAVLLEIIKEADEGVIDRSQLAGKVTAKGLKRELPREQRDALKSLVLSADFQSRQNGWIVQGDKFVAA